MAKVVLLVLFINSGGASSYGNVGTKLEYEQPDMATCEAVAAQLSNIFSIDSSFRDTTISINCINV